MRPGARPPPLDAVRSSLSLCLLALLHCVQAAGAEAGVDHGESQRFSKATAEIGFVELDTCPGRTRSVLHWSVAL